MGIAEAIRDRKLLRFSYDGALRMVEPHCYGTDRKGQALLLAYQVGGGSESREYVGWKTFQLKAGYRSRPRPPPPPRSPPP